MRVPAYLLVSFLLGCAAPRTPSDLHPSDVVELAALPPGYSAGDGLTESCRGTRGFRAIADEALGDVDCSVERLSRALRAEAATRGSRAIIGKECQVHGRERFTIHCSATLAVSTERVTLREPGVNAARGPAPAPAQVLDLDEPDPRRSAEIRVSFQPQPARSRLAPRSYDRVAETAQPAVGRALLGQVSARCQDCDAPSLRHALRVTAGRMGAGEVATVRCFDDADQKRCVASALEPWSF